MDICHAHNLNKGLSGEQRFGIRVSLPAGDTFRQVIGADWSKEHWFHSALARDEALNDMRREHLYSRRGDRPTLVFLPVERDADDAE